MPCLPDSARAEKIKQGLCCLLAAHVQHQASGNDNRIYSLRVCWTIAGNRGTSPGAYP